MKSKEQRKPNPLLREQRLLRGWSLQRVVEELCALSSVDERLPGVNAPMVSNWETGTKKPSPFYQERLCKLYNMTADKLGFMDMPVASRVSQSNPLSFDYAMLSYPQPKQPVSSNDILSSQAFIREFTDIEAENITLAHLNRSRRTALVQLLNVAGMTIIPSPDLEAWEKLTLASTHPAMINTGAFSHFQKIMNACWGLCNAGEMQAAEQILASFLPQMIQIASYHSEAAMLAAQGLRLQSIPHAHQLRFLDKITLCQQAVEYARLAHDTNTLVAALTELAVAFKYAQQTENSFNTYQEALRYTGQASPLLLSRVYAAVAASFAQRGREQEAHHYIHLAYERFPDPQEDDSHFLLADSSIFLLAYYESLVYLTMGKTEEAMKALNSFEAHPSAKMVSERSRVEILNYRGRLAILLNDLDMYANCLEEGIQIALRLKSQRRLREALYIFQRNMPATWHSEPQIRQIVEQFHLPITAMKD